MSRKNITILYSDRPFTLNYTLLPLTKSKYKKEFNFVRFSGSNTFKGSGKAILAVGIFNHKKEQRHSLTRSDEDDRILLNNLRQNFDSIAVFEDGDGAQIQSPHILDLVDVYYKKQKIKSKYLDRGYFYGSRIFTDYYYNYFGVMDGQEVCHKLPPKEDQNKIKILWNIGMVGYNVHKNLAKIAIDKYIKNFNKNMIKRPYPLFVSNKNELKKVRWPKQRIPKIGARFSRDSSKNMQIKFHRKLFMKKIGNTKKVRVGPINKLSYLKELFYLEGSISPFGHGEICFRDFESVIAGSALIKPNMDHVETFPDIYQPYYTYFPVKWDASDLENICDKVLFATNQSREIASNAWQLYINQLEFVDSRVKMLIEDLLDSSRLF